MIGVLRRLPREYLSSLVSEKPPSTLKPMLAVLTDTSFSDPEWVFERKLDGERVLAIADGNSLRLVSRNGLDFSRSYPEVVDALREVRERDLSAIGESDSDSLGSFVMDGEIVSFSDSVTSFSRLQQRMGIDDEEEARRSPVEVYYYLFDLLHLGGVGLREISLRARKEILQEIITFRDPLRFSSHRNKDGENFFEEACLQGWEGVVAKRADSTYREGRSKDWVKFKCVNRQELIIGGFTDPGGSRVGFGALLVGYFDEKSGSLRYAGKVGTGFDQETLERIARLLRARVRKTPPFAEGDRSDFPREGVHWVRPNLVGEFGFAEWTRSGKLRHPRFLGLRRDKDPEEVVREEPT